MKKFIFNIFGTAEYTLKIYYVCPDCGIFYGIVTGDKKPVFYNKNSVIISKKEIKQIPQKKCERISCQK